jgi:hypothetical protein
MAEVKTDPKLLELLERARDHKMTPEEIDAQRRSWVRGNVGLSYPDMPAERLDALMRLALGPSLSEQLATARREARNKALEEAAMVADGLGIAYADFALCGIPEQARVREAMNAAAQKISSAIRALKEEG